ncbi:hypothetical protein TKK_0016828 [Trichogramma kaykai]
MFGRSRHRTSSKSQDLSLLAFKLIENQATIKMPNGTSKSAPVDVRIEFEAAEDFPNNTTAYCLILHDQIIEQNIMSEEIKKLA